MRKLTRRVFLATLGAASAAAGAQVPQTASHGRSPPAGGPMAHPPAPGYRFLTPIEVRFIAAACNRLIPAEGADAGALEAGVPRYVDAQLASEWGRGRRPYREGAWQPGTPTRLETAESGPRGRTPAETFRAALAAVLEQLRRRDFDFAGAPAASQTLYLRSLASGAVALDGVCSAGFFDLLLTMTVEGFFGHPQLGGTRDRLAWPMRGYPGACARTV